ncbi:MAG: DNA repair protein RecN [Bacteroidales bacterium]
MLKHLSVTNYALIEKLEIGFDKGFSVITGETGAGKSILLGALSLIIGNRAEVKVLSNKEKKCIVEATFKIDSYSLELFFQKYELDYDSVCIIRREILPSGKSRGFINDTPVRLPIMKELGSHLMNVHSQHQTLELNTGEFQIHVFDSFSKTLNLVSEYSCSYKKYKCLELECNDLLAEENKARQEQDFLQFQFNELESACLLENEFQELEKERDVLNNSSLIKEKLFCLDQTLSDEENGVVSVLTTGLSAIQSLESFSDEYKDLITRLDSACIELKDIAFEADRLVEEVTLDPNRLQEIEDRLDVIYRLMQKHRVNSVNELLALQKDLESKIDKYSSLEDEIEKIKNQLNTLQAELQQKAGVLSKQRRDNLLLFQKEIQEIIRELGMPNALFLVDLSTDDRLTVNGFDSIKFKFTANKGGELLELSKAASGGELSRVMLAIKSLIASSNVMPTIIFDEIDTGISGEVAGKVGNILSKMSKKHQLITITHLPQIAGKGNHHYWVYKKTDDHSTKSNIRLLTKEERVTELAKMLSNEKITESAIEAARELLTFN